MTTFSDRLREARKLRKLSQAKLAKLCKLTQSAISNYENGTRQASRDILTVARVLNVRAQWLQDGTGPMQADFPTQMVLQTQLEDYIYTWPFKDISVQEIHDLTPEMRQELEQMMRYVINGMTKK